MRDLRRDATIRFRIFIIFFLQFCDSWKGRFFQEGETEKAAEAAFSEV